MRLAKVAPLEKDAGGKRVKRRTCVTILLGFAVVVLIDCLIRWRQAQALDNITLVGIFSELQGHDAQAPSSQSSQTLDGVLLVLLPDVGTGDLAAEGPAAIPRGKNITSSRPTSYTSFRVASPDTVPSQLAWITGQHPSRHGTLHAQDISDYSLIPADHNALLKTLRAANVKVGHFGTWDLPSDIAADTDDHLITADAQQAVRAAQHFIKRCVDANQRFYAQVWLPPVDLAFESGSWARELLEREPGVSDDSPTCRDIRRRTTHPHRYKSCPRMIHRANKRRERELVGNVIDTLFATAPNLPFLAAVSSTNGPETPEIYGHAAGSTHYRGKKRSLYDGGIRVPFLVWTSPSVVTHTPQSRPHLVSALDWAPTCVSFFGIPTLKGSAERDGIDHSAYFLGPGSLPLRRAPLVWEWREPTPDSHCIEVAPRLAIMYDHKYKLFLEPSELGNVSNPLHVELYRVHDEGAAHQGHYERANLVKVSKLQSIAAHHIAGLQTWHAEMYPDTTPRASVRGSCREHFEAAFSTRQKMSSAQENKARAAQKNVRGIIIMLADDLGFGDLSAFNAPVQSEPHDNDDSYMNRAGGSVFRPNTPSLDRLASQGVVFSNFYANAAVCSPTRASLMTGRYPFHSAVAMHWQTATSAAESEYFGVTPYLGAATDEPPTNAQAPLQDPIVPRARPNVYLSRLFREAGFVTGHFGKWHLGNLPKTEAHRSPLHPSYGIDEAKVYSASKGVLPSSATYEHNDLYFASHIQRDVVTQTIEFLRARVERKERFFVNFWFQNAHAPLNLAEDGQQARELGLGFAKLPFPERQFASLVEKERFPNEAADPHLPLQIYRALLKDHDQQVGRLVDWIDSQGLRDDVLIVYLSDNGPENAGVYFASQGSAGPFRGGKRSLYEGGLRVPLVMRGPGLAANTLWSRPGMTADILPTVARYAGISLNASLTSAVEGVDLFSANEDRSLLFEFRGWAHGADCMAHSARFAVRRGRFKLYAEPRDPRQAIPRKLDPIELYDLEADPAEMTSVLGEFPEEAKRMTQALFDYLHSDNYDQAYTPSRKARAKRRQQLVQCRQWLANSSLPVGEPYLRVKHTQIGRDDLFRFPFVFDENNL
ncbi:Arylsulfatase [Hondaea fermentalgiana]|uniref:Arylsulfatase n=1 Tax=Hondaea fermentalgiana TaxID=2315210 RepID=A0A2R5GEG3_9STRA|nr:Arylsulfatase [Hondaea fermentalgiana]|eukprot:GBG29316.1 Arylsulfatase [Hondaea fermentalgiana]